MAFVWSPVADPGFLEGGFCYIAARTARAKFWKPRPFLSEPRPFWSFWAKLPICFRLLESSLRLTHTKVSHSSSFLRSVPRAGGSISWKSKPLHNVLVFQVCQRGFPRKLWKPVWIRYWSHQLNNSYTLDFTSYFYKPLLLPNYNFATSIDSKSSFLKSSHNINVNNTIPPWNSTSTWWYIIITVGWVLIASIY